jgi:hypothetical protein
MSAGFANMPVFPMSIAITRLLHNAKYNTFLITMEVSPPNAKPSGKMCKGYGIMVVSVVKRS